jgi:hypothetical protein
MSDKLEKNGVLSRGDSLESESEQYTFTLQDDGNLVLYKDGQEQALWASGTAEIEVEKCVLQEDGNFVIYDSENQPVWATQTAGHNLGYLIIQDDGNAVIYNDQGKAIWATQTASSVGINDNPATWMESEWDYIGNKQLWQVTLPGTHDSGAYNLSTQRVPSECRDAPGFLLGITVRPFAEAQEDDFAGQLNGGIRYFDLRLWHRQKENDFHAYHDCVGAEISDILNQIKSFMEKVKKELVIINVSHFCQFDESAHALLISKIDDIIGTYLYKEHNSNLLQTEISDYVASGPRVLLIYADPYISNNPKAGFWKEDDLKMNGTYANTSNLDTMRADQLNKLKQNPGNSESLFLLSWTLTITDFDDSFVWGSLKRLSHNANHSLAPFVKEYGGQYQINILYVDFYADAGVTNLAILMNRGLYDQIPVAGDDEHLDLTQPKPSGSSIGGPRINRLSGEIEVEQDEEEETPEEEEETPEEEEETPEEEEETPEEEEETPEEEEER